MTEQAKTSIALFQGMPHQCSYLPDEVTQLQIVDPTFTMHAGFYGALLAQGFRRSGDMVYRPGCLSCKACLPARIPVNRFSPNRSQRRCLQKNADMQIKVRPLSHFNDAHFALYTSYLRSRHADGDMVDHNESDMSRFLGCHWGEVLLLEGWLNDQLCLVAVTDKTPLGLSALYTFFAPELEERGLGNFAILQQLAECQRQGLPWLYLGYWIAECRKMAYKSNFKPLEILLREQWRELLE
jgi:arginine-tRNA-protein transferase